MKSVDIICLANSRKLKGRCIVGVRLNGGGWLRPVGHTETGELYPKDYNLDDGTEPRLMDTLRVHLSHADPTPYQPENWAISRRKWKLKSRPTHPKKIWQLFLPILQHYSASGPELFGNCSDRVRHSTFVNNPVDASVVVVAPRSVKWGINYFNRRRRTRAIFSLDGTKYNLAVTDPRWEERLNDLEEGVHSAHEVGIQKHEKVFLTVSIGEPYKGFCYKLVSAVIVLSASKNTAASIKTVSKKADAGHITKRYCVRREIIRSKASRSKINKGKLSYEEFAKRKIKELRKPPYKGIHSVYSGFNQAFRKYFDNDPVQATQELAKRGKIVLVPVKGGVILYLPESR